MKREDVKECGYQLFTGNQYALLDQMKRRLVKIERDKIHPIADCDIQREAVKLQREYADGLMAKYRYKYDEKSKAWKFASSQGGSGQGIGAVEVAEELLEILNSS